MNRWNLTSLLDAAKRGATALFVCSVVLLPLFLAAMQWGHVFSKDDDRKVVALEQLAVRPIDRTQAQIKPFEQPLITVTFDDGWQSIYTTGLPLLHKYGVPTTQYVLSGVSDDKNYLTIDQIKSMQKAGHEIGCHSIDHTDLTTLSQDTLDMQLTDCKTIFERELGIPINHFASPYGRTNNLTIDAIKQRYQSHRNTNGDITTNGVSDQDVNVKTLFNMYNIHAITIRRETTPEQLQQAIDFTVKSNGWLVLNYHDVEEGGSTYGLNSQSLETQLAAINRAPARVVTIGQFMDAYRTSNATSTTRQDQL